jgi:uncharacterized protein YjbI with pentapeptide repeats
LAALVAAVLSFAAACIEQPPPVVDRCDAPAAPGVDWHDCDKSGLVLPAGTDLSGADLSGADLSGADLDGVILAGADLSGADLGSVLLGLANLVGANLAGADIDGVDFSYADLSDAYGIPTGDAYFDSTTCPDGSTTSWPESCRFTPMAGLGECAAAAAPEVDWHNCDKAGLILPIGTDLSGANLSGADLEGAKVREVDLTGADLSGVHAPGPTTHFHDSVLAGADLSNANLSGASMPRTILTGVNLSGTLLADTVLVAADLTGATGVPIGDAFYEDTICPDGSYVAEPLACTFAP